MRAPREQWIKDVPHSRMAYPSAPHDRLKYLFWRVYTPLHPFLRDLSTALGIITHEGRQDFLLGILDPARSLREFVSFLVEQGFGNHFIAWKDTDEVVSLRRTVGFKYQYHLRIFRDGEVRCHYEFTPEYRPIGHLIQVGFEDRSSEFKTIVQDWVIAPGESLQA